MISNASPSEPLTKTRFTARKNGKPDYPDWDHVTPRFRRLLFKTKQTQTMKALVLNRYGGLEQVVFADLQRPVPKPDEILVQVHAAGLIPVDNKIRAGEMKPLLRLKLPATMGSDLAGKVVTEVSHQLAFFFAAALTGSEDQFGDV